MYPTVSKKGDVSTRAYQQVIGSEALQLPQHEQERKLKRILQAANRHLACSTVF